MRYEWDPRKNAANIAKHGIDFTDVPGMFGLPMLVNADVRDYGEDRWIGLGWLKTVVTVIVFTDNDDVIRLISARKATQHEVEEFKKHLPH